MRSGRKLKGFSELLVQFEDTAAEDKQSGGEVSLEPGAGTSKSSRHPRSAFKAIRSSATANCWSGLGVVSVFPY